MNLPPCERCEESQEELGALMFGPPDAFGRVRKVHLCRVCFRNITARWLPESGRTEQP